MPFLPKLSLFSSAFCFDFLLTFGEALGLSSEKIPSESDATSELAKLPRLDTDGELAKVLTRLDKVQPLDLRVAPPDLGSDSASES